MGRSGGSTGTQGGPGREPLPFCSPAGPFHSDTNDGLNCYVTCIMISSCRFAYFAATERGDESAGVSRARSILFLTLSHPTLILSSLQL